MSENQLAAFGSIPFSPAALAKPKQNLDRGYAPRLQLVSTGTSNLAMDKKAEVGNWAIVDGESVVDLGDSVVVIPLCRLEKAVDFSNSDNDIGVVSAFGADTEAYIAIQKASDEFGYDSNCMYGPLYLGFCVTTCQFVEYFCNNKSSRNEAPRLDAFLPISAEAAKQYKVEAREPVPVSFCTKKVKGRGKNKNQWYVPVITAHEGELNVENPPVPEDLAKACANFVKQTIVEEDDRDR